MDHVYESFIIGLLFLPNKSNNVEYDKQTVLNMILIHDIGEAFTGDFPPSYYQYHEMKKSEDEACKEIFFSGLHRNVADLYDYLKLWLAWSDPTDNNYNVRIAREIDKIQMLYKLLILVKDEGLKPTSDRFNDFWKAKLEIQSKEGKEIFDHLIMSDHAFQNILEEYGVVK